MAWELVEDEPQEEGWGQFALRQVAKAPATIARIPGVVGDVQQAVLGVAGLGKEEAQKSWPKTIARRLAAPIQLPTTEEIRNVERKILPEYMTETRPGFAENAAEFVTQAAATGGLSGIAQAVKGGATAGQALRAGGQAIKQLSPKTLGGAYAGSHIGGEAAASLDLSPDAQTLASIVGGGLGAGAAHLIGTEAPSTKLGKKAFIQNKKAQLNELETTKNTQLAELEQTKIDFETQQKALEQKSTTGYGRAKEIAPKIKAGAQRLVKAIKEISNSLIGIEEAEQKRINALLEQAESIIEGDTVSLEKAIQLKENLRATVYDKNVPTSIRNKGKFLHREVSELIKEAGEANPEHGIPFQEAETSYTELKNRQKQQKKFTKDYETQKKKINKDYEKQKASIEKQTYESNQKQQATNFWDAVKGLGIRQSIWHGLRSVLGKQFSSVAALGLEGIRWSASEFNKVNKILKENPALKAEVKATAELIKNKNWSAATAAIQKLDQSFEELEKPKNEWVLVE